MFVPRCLVRGDLLGNGKVPIRTIDSIVISYIDEPVTFAFSKYIRYNAYTNTCPEKVDVYIMHCTAARSYNLPVISGHEKRPRPSCNGCRSIQIT